MLRNIPNPESERYIELPADEKDELYLASPKENVKPPEEWTFWRTLMTPPSKSTRKRLTVMQDELRQQLLKNQREEQMKRRKQFYADNGIVEEDDEEKSEADGLEDDQEPCSSKDADDEESKDSSSDSEFDVSDGNALDLEDANNELSEDIVEEPVHLINESGPKATDRDERPGSKTVDEESASTMDERESKGIDLDDKLDPKAADEQPLPDEDPPIFEQMNNDQAINYYADQLNVYPDKVTSSEWDEAVKFSEKPLVLKPWTPEELQVEFEKLKRDQARRSISRRENFELLWELSNNFRERCQQRSQLISSDGQDFFASRYQRIVISDEGKRMSCVDKAAKRKWQIDSDDEDPFNTNSLDTSPGRLKKWPKLDDDFFKLNNDVFQVDNDEDSLDMYAGNPFFNASRVFLDDDDDEDEKVNGKTSKVVASNQADSERQSKADEGESGSARPGFVDDEAALSGSDVDSDSEYEDAEQNEYEPMEGDNDELPDEDELLAGIIKTHNKLQNIMDERNLNQLKEQYSDNLMLATHYDRSFRSNFQDRQLDFKSLVGDPLQSGNANSDDEEEDEIISIQDHLAKKAAEQEEKDKANLFMLTAFADDLSQDIIDDEASSHSKTYPNNPNGIGKFICDD